MSVLSRSDLAFFEENGYVVARNVVPPELLEPVIAAVWEFLEMNPDAPETWYPETPRIGGIVHIHQHQALWDTRQHPPVHAAFADIYGTAKLWVSMDRASMKPPYNPKYPAHEDKGFIHWDLDTTKLPTELFVQGVLYLTDTTEEMGGFQCVPGFHRDLETWIRQQPPDRNPRHPDLSRLPEGRKVTPVPGKAGDLVIWNTLLAHGNGHNVSDRPRLAQYITMYPAKESDDESRQERIACWQERRPPKWWPGDPRQREQQFGKTAELTPLGRKLLGLDLW
jgi:ectoine hydroxylase-related dioxygenase (phytanoyl-CoA dioxygenase family)